MTFNEWYDMNKERLTTFTLESMLHEAFNAGHQSGWDSHKELIEQRAKYFENIHAKIAKQVQAERIRNNADV